MKKIHITPGVIKRFKQFLTGKYIEDGATARQNIPAGKWIIWKGQVCKAKTAITAGDTLSSSNLGTDEEGTLNWTNGAFLDFDNAVDISARTSASNYYETPEKGCILGCAGWWATGTFKIYDKSTTFSIFGNSEQGCIAAGGNISGTSSNICIPVKKGAQIYWSSKVGMLYFVPYA